MVDAQNSALDNRGHGLPCPVCKVDLLMSDRQGIEIDYCPKCRGVWLDRGELDKIIERSMAEGAPVPQAPAYPAQPAPQAQAYPAQSGHGGSHGSGHGGSRHGSGHGSTSGGNYEQRGHKGSFLSRLFD